MPCCGDRRQKFHGTTPTSRPPESAETTLSQSPLQRYSTVYFEYLGTTGLTVVGSTTRKRYRFDGHGAIIAVDLRDRLSLSAVPKLRQVLRP